MNLHKLTESNVIKSKIIPIRKNFSLIIVTKFDDEYYHYYLNDLSTKNKQCGIGVWKIKLKKPK